MTPINWKRLFCASVTLAVHNRMLETNTLFPCGFPMTAEDRVFSQQIKEEVFTEYPSLRKWHA